MRSSDGKYWIGLDHVRALAALMVFSWHFLHANAECPAPWGASPWLAWLDEGSTGVALFMTLSGYLFAKLLYQREVNYRAFVWNRALRLLPLLTLVVILQGIGQWYINGSLLHYFIKIIGGVVWPSLPNGGWSITVEAHFYLLLPLLLIAVRRYPYVILILVSIFCTYRLCVWEMGRDVRFASYLTIFGRFDQFALGMLAFYRRALITHKHPVALAILLFFMALYGAFDHLGGYFGAPSWIWIGLGTVEGAAYGALIAWYDNSFSHSHGPASRFIALIGECSYSIYLLHPFLELRMAEFINHHIMKISSIYLAMIWMIISFILFLPFAYLSYRFVEKPFLNLRLVYTKGVAKDVSVAE